MNLIDATLSTVVVGLALAGAALAQPAPPAESGTPPVPQHNCVLKQLSSCKPDGSCARLDNFKGEKLPVKVTVDLETGIVAGVDPAGWVDATRIASLARSGDAIILQGIDNAVAWQLMIDEKREAMSLLLSAADTSSVGFGDCTIPKER